LKKYIKIMHYFLKKLKNKKNNIKRTKSGASGLDKPGPTPGPMKQWPVLGPTTLGQSAGLFLKEFNGAEDVSSALSPPTISKKKMTRRLLQPRIRPP
jgi:hypothetical protein